MCLSFLNNNSFPSCPIFFFSSFSEFLIFDLALEVLTKLNQSSLGDCLFDVIISTWYPLLSKWEKGTNFPLTFAPRQWLPTSVWIS